MSQPSIAIVWEVGPIEESIGPRLTHLLEHGWDAHVLCVLPSLDGIATEAQRLRLHPPPPVARRRAPRPRLVAGAFRSAIRRPRASWRLWTCRDPRLRYLGGVLMALDPAVVHFSSVGAATRFESVVSTLPARIVVSLAGADPKELASIVPRLDVLHVESDADVEALRKRLPGEQEIAVVPPDRDEELLVQVPRATRDGDVFRILSVGALGWEEGYEHALQAIALLADREIACRYRIVGRGEFADAVGFARHQLGVERLVEIVEPTDREELRAHLTWADVLVSATVVPRSPRIVLDALTAGVPVVATDLPASAAAAGRLIPRRDPQALADALAELAENPALCRQLGEAGRHRARAAIGTEERLGRFEEIYRSALTRGRS